MTSNISSPVALEKFRRKRAEQAMDAYCKDLAEVCERPETDELTAKIYKVAREARETAGEVETTSDTPPWVEEADRVLQRMVTKVSWETKDRVRQVFRYRVSDPDVEHCKERVEQFFDPHAAPTRTRQAFVACLLDFAFIRIDEVRPKEAALERAPFPGPVMVPPHEVGHMESTLMLGRTIRWGGTLLGGMGIFLTGAVWLIPMIFVAWLASWVLIDQKAIERRRALEASSRKALEAGDD